MNLTPSTQRNIELALIVLAAIIMVSVPWIEKRNSVMTIIRIVSSMAAVVLWVMFAVVINLVKLPK